MDATAPDDFALVDAHEFLDSLRGKDQAVIIKAIEGLYQLVAGKGFGAVTVAVVAGKIRQAEFKQTVQD